MARTGSLVNNLMSTPIGNREVNIDQAATILMFSDRYAATIVAITRFKTGEKKGQVKSVIVREDTSKIIKGNEQDGSAQYKYSYNDNGEDTEFFVTKDGRFKSKGGTFLSIGTRETYRDPSF